MKKAVYFLSIFVFMVCLLSCSKDDEVYSLSGTKWERIDGSVTTTFKFYPSLCTYTISSNILEQQTTISYDYIIAYPKVYMAPQTSGYADLEGTISNDNMIVVNTSKSTTLGAFRKQ